MAIATPNMENLPMPERRGWMREEFERAAKLGLFKPDERLELIEGEIIKRMVQNSPHAAAIGALQEALGPAFATGYWMRFQLPLAVGSSSLLEPDIAAVSGSWRDYADAHPTTAVLVIEVADSSLAYDRTTKAGLYARAGVTEYWILNLSDRTLEVHRQPTPMTGRPLGHYYGSVTRHTETETIAPLAAPNHPIAIADLLP